MAVSKYLKGQVVGFLTVVEAVGANAHRRMQYLCLCRCGTYAVKSSDFFKTKNPNCGCDSRLRQGPVAHGGSRRSGSHELYDVWKAIRARCNQPSCKSFKYYGAKGIRVSERWNDFANFVADMGPRPSKKHEVDRIDSAGNYGPDNCQWLPKVENVRKALAARYEGKVAA